MTSFYQGRWVITSKIGTGRQKSEWFKENPYATRNPSFHPYTSWKSEQWGLNPSSWDPCILYIGTLPLSPPESMGWTLSTVSIGLTNFVYVTLWSTYVAKVLTEIASMIRRAPLWRRWFQLRSRSSIASFPSTTGMSYESQTDGDTIWQSHDRCSTRTCQVLHIHRCIYRTVEPDLIATEMLVFPSKLSTNQHDGDSKKQEEIAYISYNGYSFYSEFQW